MDVAELLQRKTDAMAAEATASKATKAGEIQFQLRAKSRGQSHIVTH